MSVADPVTARRAAGISNDRPLRAARPARLAFSHRPRTHSSQAHRPRLTAPRLTAPRLTMRIAPIAAALVATLVAGCTSTPKESVFLRAAEASLPSGSEVRGQLLDADGQPLKGRVRAVTEAGSCSVGTLDDGVFELTLPSWPVTLVAASDTGEILCFTESGPSAEFRSIALSEPGAWLDLENAGTRTTRVSVRYRGVPVVDMTLRPGEPERVCVPAGELIVKFQHDDSGHEVLLEVGATGHLVTAPGSQ